VSSSETPLGKWQYIKRDIAADYKVFFPKEDVPPIFGVRIQTNCQFPIDEQGVAIGKRVSEGAVGRLQFVAKSPN
jgi:hypothetical protein